MVTLNQAAVAYTQGQAQMYDSPGMVPGSETGSFAAHDANGTHRELLGLTETVSIDAYLEKHNIEEVFVLKIDIEGVGTAWPFCV